MCLPSLLVIGGTTSHLLCTCVLLLDSQSSRRNITWLVLGIFNMLTFHAAPCHACYLYRYSKVLYRQRCLHAAGGLHRQEVWEVSVSPWSDSASSPMFLPVC